MALNVKSIFYSALPPLLMQAHPPRKLTIPSHRRPALSPPQRRHRPHPQPRDQHRLHGRHHDLRRHHASRRRPLRSRPRHLLLRPLQSRLHPPHQVASLQARAPQHHGQLRLSRCFPLAYDHLRSREVHRHVARKAAVGAHWETGGFCGRDLVSEFGGECAYDGECY